MPCISHYIPSVNKSNDSLNNEKIEDTQRQKIETYVVAKLNEYSREKSTNLFHLTSLFHIRRRLKRDIKYLLKQHESYSIPEKKILQWIDETLERINSSIPCLQSFIDSRDELQQLLFEDRLFSSNDISNQWQQLQIRRAKILFADTNHNERELLLIYQKHIVESLTPKISECNRLPLKNEDYINLDFEYDKAESKGREYLKTIFDDYKKRQYPNINLIKEMIHLGMEQMVKRPTKDELQKASTSSNILSKAFVFLKSKNAYVMNLKNVADDFMVTQFSFPFFFSSVFSEKCSFLVYSSYVSVVH